MSTFDRIKKLAEEQKIPVSELERKLGMGQNSLYKWKNQKPTIEKLQKVADFFHVSVDYLLGRTNIKNQLDALDDAQFLDVDGLTAEDIAKVESVIAKLREAQRTIDELENK
ncbi:helix-turn-helix transcriptional regulator [Listeria marthii]|uniref:helix-turn-helix domain-containing protein n=1 Tax=Listeria marthii TaxID=529731 RepID=UPI001889A502|nr:helix-turn-helix transcriptional regulator [Listeria marthii]MBF2513941.1 helix-turn-helix transcriptional regulator [Listeria marthii]MBF2519404.1 helix-turn-helix transcriptional regulator [Listeria marthii]